MLHMRDTRNGCVLACTRTHTLCLPLTTPPSTSAAAPPPPPHTIVSIDACRTQCGGHAVCCEGRLAERAGGGPTGVNINCKHAHRGPAQRTPRPSCARPCHKNAATNTPGTTNHTHGAWEGAQCGSWGAGTLCLSAPFAKPRPPEESPQTALSSHHCLMLR